MVTHLKKSPAENLSATTSRANRQGRQIVVPPLLDKELLLRESRIESLEQQVRKEMDQLGRIIGGEGEHHGPGR